MANITWLTPISSEASMFSSASPKKVCTLPLSFLLPSFFLSCSLSPWPLFSFTLSAWIIKHWHVFVYAPLPTPVSSVLTFPLLSGSESDGLALSHLYLSFVILICFLVCPRRAVERQQSSNGRSVLRSVSVVWGWLCESVCVHICTGEEGNCVSLLTKSEFWFDKWVCTDTGRKCIKCYECVQIIKIIINLFIVNLLPAVLVVMHHTDTEIYKLNCFWCYEKSSQL